MLSEHAIVKKKAIMCAAKMMRKVPDSIEAINFHKMKLFSEKNNSVFLTLCHLLQELRNYENYETQLYQAKQQLSYFEKFFKKLVTADFNPDYSVNGVNDPFLQVKIIQLLKSFRPGRNGSKEEFSTVIQIASSAENSSNSNGARLFECVKTMLSHVSESCFKAMAIDILARFLNSKDNNFKFVSLNTLSDSIREKEMILQHQFTIMDCLWDKDSSISNRALDLLHNLTCEKNYKITIKEFLKFMSKKNLDSESSKSLLIKIFNTLEKHEKDSKRYIDLLSAAISKTSKTDEFVNRKFSNFIKRGDAKTQKYFVDKMAETIFEHISEPILNLAFWGMGEYFDLAETQNKKKIIKAMDLIGADPLLVLSEKSIYFYANTLFKILLANNKKLRFQIKSTSLKFIIL
ncbi:hypothetical protein MHBO_000750 [Bonamia ostreae]|uniref:Clathrin/coatomer adaptor adaptin-like N-terminal domain-containing protein n=1 Tax=Bonamia ostreae TaxID=126728 RepID=A0ABV2AGR6_9EUKA